MAEIVKLIVRKHEVAHRTDDVEDKSFQLLFFTGVRYERNSTPNLTFAKSALPSKKSARKKVAKA